MQELKWYLFDPESGEKVDLTSKEVWTIGRARSNDFPINDQSVSSRHAEIHYKDGKFHVIDLNSFNSTYINGNEIKADIQMRLKVKDSVQFGDKVFYFSATEANQALLDLPSLTDSFKIGANKTQDVIVHNYEEPILDLASSKKKSSLKSLREQKEEIEKLHARLEQVIKDGKGKEKRKALAELKAKELEEFNTYLKVKQYDTISSVEATIDSIKEVRDRIDVDKAKLMAEIKEREKQIQNLKNELMSLDNEKKTNDAIISELKNDIEIIKGRDALEEELSSLYREIRSFEKEDVTQKITMIQALIDEKEKEFKKVQKEYADDRFGKKTNLYGNKKAS